MEYAAIVGGCAGCATLAGAELAGIAPSGTIPHALCLVMGDTVKATLAFDRYFPADVRRIALVDTFKDEAEESLRVAQALGDRLWGVRLDTPRERGRVTPDLVREVLKSNLTQTGALARSMGSVRKAHRPPATTAAAMSNIIRR